MKHNKQNLINDKKTLTRDDFVFFWGYTDRTDGVGKSCLSQWYMCLFTVDNVYYNCAEQYMMAEKARIFGDEDAWHQIMASDDPMTMKELNPLFWQGENLLGFTLMDVRDMLRGKMEEAEGDVKKALLMWTMGAGNSARRFNYEDPMPQKDSSYLMQVT